MISMNNFSLGEIQENISSSHIEKNSEDKNTPVPFTINLGTPPEGLQANCLTTLEEDQGDNEPFRSGGTSPITTAVSDDGFIFTRSDQRRPFSPDIEKREVLQNQEDSESKSNEVLPDWISEKITPEAIDLMLSESAGGSAQSYGAVDFGLVDAELIGTGQTMTALRHGVLGPREVPNAGEYEGRSGIFLLGTGPSTSIPQIEHVFSTVISPEERGTKKCRNCLAAWSDPTHPNNCDNICVVIAVAEPAEDDDERPPPRTQTPSTDGNRAGGVASPPPPLDGLHERSSGEHGGDRPGKKHRKHLLVDMGKTFRQSMLKWMPKFGITQIDAILLSHEHQDAFGGLDELRCLQRFAAAPGDEHQVAMYKYAAQNRLPIILSENCMEAVERVYCYIVEASRSKAPIDRKVAVVDFMPQRIPDDTEPISDEVDTVEIPLSVLDRLTVKKLPVYHGGDLISFGYAFGRGYESIVYISDVSWISDRTMALVDSFVPFKVLVIDSLYDSHPHFSHLCLYEAYDLIDRWRPAETYIVGMGCMIDRGGMNKHLKDVVVPNLRSGAYQPYKFTCIGADQPETFRPLLARNRLQQMPPAPNRPPPEHISSVQVALDGTFIPVNFQLDR